MRTVILCEGTTDLLMIQFVLQYKYGWKYDGFTENSETNALLNKKLKKNNDIIKIINCRGIMNIPQELLKIKDIISLATKKDEFIDKVIVLIDHDTINSNKEFIDEINKKVDSQFDEININSEVTWTINSVIYENINVALFIKCVPERQTGAIEDVLLMALTTDEIEQEIIDESRQFVSSIAKQQDRYLQRKSLISKAIFNTYFSIRVPEEAYKERARTLNAFDWKSNQVLEEIFDFLNV